MGAPWGNYPNPEEPVYGIWPPLPPTEDAIGNPIGTTYKPGTRGKLGIPVGWHIDPRTGEIVMNAGRRGVNPNPGYARQAPPGPPGYLPPDPVPGIEEGPWPPPDQMMGMLPPNYMGLPVNKGPFPGAMKQPPGGTPIFQPPLPGGQKPPTPHYTGGDGRSPGGGMPRMQRPMQAPAGAMGSRGLGGLAQSPIQRGGRKTFPGSRLLY